MKYIVNTEVYLLVIYTYIYIYLGMNFVDRIRCITVQSVS